MSTNFIRIPANGSPEVVVLTDGADELAFLQGIVGGYIEAVTVTENGYTLFVNEEGALRGLPVNEVATGLARTPVVGDAVLAGPELDGETTSVDLDAVGVRWGLDAPAQRGRDEVRL